jgi:hypothetical protein
LLGTAAGARQHVFWIDGYVITLAGIVLVDDRLDSAGRVATAKLSCWDDPRALARASGRMTRLPCFSRVVEAILEAQKILPSTYLKNAHTPNAHAAAVTASRTASGHPIAALLLELLVCQLVLVVVDADADPLSADGALEVHL